MLDTPVPSHSTIGEEAPNMESNKTKEISPENPTKSGEAIWMS